MNDCNNCEQLSACEDAVCDRKRVNCPFFKNLLNIVYEDDEDYYIVNGEAFYEVVNDEIVLQRATDESFPYEVFDLIGGKSFLCSGFDSDDGILCGVIVDGYLSNIYLSDCETSYVMRPDHNHSGEFIYVLGASLWKKLCSEHEVIVNWANR